MLEGGKSAGAGLSFMVAIAASMDVFSAVMSSPWSTETFGTDATLPSVKRYVGHGVALGLTVGFVGAFLDQSPWAALGSAVAVGYMVFLYHTAVLKAQGRA